MNIQVHCQIYTFIFLTLGTYCQQREVEAITEGVEDDDGLFLNLQIFSEI